jgi:hypothetical protein
VWLLLLRLELVDENNDSKENDTAGVVAAVAPNS